MLPATTFVVAGGVSNLLKNESLFWLTIITAECPNNAVLSKVIKYLNLWFVKCSLYVK